MDEKPEDQRGSPPQDRRVKRLEGQENNSSIYIIVLLNFLLGIAAVLVMIMILHQKSEINTLRNKVLCQKNELEQCSGLKNDCIQQLGCFYRDPLKELQNNKKGQIHVSNKH